MYTVGLEHNTVLPPYAVRVWEEMVGVPSIIDPNYFRVTQQSKVCIDHAFILQINVSYAAMLTPKTHRAGERSVTMEERRRINPD